MLQMKEEQIQLKILEYEAKADIEIRNIKEGLQKKYYYQGWKIIQNWIFSVIADQEKCFRYAFDKCTTSKNSI